MTKPFYALQEVNQHRYRVLADTGIREHVLCEIAQYEPINTWYLVQKSLNHELSEQALKFIYESVKRLNGGCNMKEYEILIEYYDLLSNSRKMCWDFFTPEEGKDVYKSLYAQVCWKYGDSADILNYEEFE